MTGRIMTDVINKELRCTCGRLLFKTTNYPDVMELYCHGCKGIVLLEKGEIIRVKTKQGCFELKK